MASTTKTTERIPEYYYQWNADEKFEDLKNLLAAHTPNAQRVNELTQEIRFKTQYRYGEHEYAIGILTNLSNSIEGSSGFGKDVEKFEKKYRGVYDTYEDFLEGIQESINVLLEIRRKKFREIVKLEEELKEAEKAKAESWAKYRALDDKYEAEFNKLLEAQKEEDAKKSQEEVAV